MTDGADQKPGQGPGQTPPLSAEATMEAWRADIAALVDSTVTQPLITAIRQAADGLTSAVLSRCELAFVSGGQQARQQMAEMAALRRAEMQRLQTKVDKVLPRAQLRTEPPAQRDRRH